MKGFLQTAWTTSQFECLSRRFAAGGTHPASHPRGATTRKASFEGRGENVSPDASPGVAAGGVGAAM